MYNTKGVNCDPNNKVSGEGTKIQSFHMQLRYPLKQTVINVRFIYKLHDNDKENTHKSYIKEKEEGIKAN